MSQLFNIRKGINWSSKFTDNQIFWIFFKHLNLILFLNCVHVVKSVTHFNIKYIYLKEQSRKGEVFFSVETIIFPMTFMESSQFDKYLLTQLQMKA